MNILLSVLQVLLALHTAVGALWKLSNAEQAVSSLRAIPHVVWSAMTLVELLCCVGLILPLFKRRLGVLAVLAAACIAVEMLVFCGLHLASGSREHGHLIYWLVVAAVCAVIVYGRRSRQPH